MFMFYKEVNRASIMWKACYPRATGQSLRDGFKAAFLPLPSW